MTELKLQQCRLDGRYDIQDCLGRGSYAEIYVAHDGAAADGAPRTVVIKALNVLLQGVPDAELERTLVENFQNEAVALDRVRHSNIISRLGHGTAIDLSGVTFHYLVLEYLAGGDMAALCRHHPLPLDRALFYLEQVCAGLAHAHKCGVIHRDIKPQNLLLTSDHQTVKIADFGVAKIEASEGAITRVGTNVFAPPEHNPMGQTGPLDAASLTQPSLLTPAADIYSLAKTTYTLLAGESPRRFSHRQITDLPITIAEKVWASSVLRVLKRATERVPGERYQTVEEFWAELADAALPPTQPLHQQHDAQNRQPSISRHLSDTGTLAQAPPRPRFDSTRDLKQTKLQDNGHTRPRIVVRVAENEKAAPLAPHQMSHRPAHEIIEGMPDAPARHKKKRPPTSVEAGRGNRLIVAAALILAFAGILLLTYSYFRGRGLPWKSAPPAVVQKDVGKEGIVNRTSNLRSDPVKSDDTKAGVVEKGARVRVLQVSDDEKWCEVEVIPADGSSNSVARGWVFRKYIDLNS
jgi:serine/threonine protein kinase